MLQFISNKGGGKPVGFEKAILDGFASDGGLYVPDSLPEITLEHLGAMERPELCRSGIRNIVSVHRSVNSIGGGTTAVAANLLWCV